MTLITLIALAGRKIVFSYDDAEAFFIDLWKQGALIGYVCLARASSADEVKDGCPVSGFEAAELLSPHSPFPDPAISLSTVLWPQQVLLEELAGFPFSRFREGQLRQVSQRSSEEGCPRET